MSLPQNLYEERKFVLKDKAKDEYSPNETCSLLSSTPRFHRRPQQKVVEIRKLNVSDT